MNHPCRQLSCSVLLGAILSHAAAVMAGTPLQVGVNVHVGQVKDPVDQTLAALLEQGFTSFRDGVNWSRVEQTRGEFVYPASMHGFDDLVTRASAAGQHPLIVLTYGNRLYDNGGFVTSASAIEAYVRYAQFIVRHFKGRVTQYEIWNEWDHGSGLPAALRAPGSPEAYVALLRAAYRAIKAEDPAITVIGPASASIDLGWIERFARAGGFDYIDGFSVHPYNFSEQRRVRGLSMSPISGTPEKAIESLQTLKQAIDRLAPGRDIKIHVTEMGWPTHTSGTPEPIAAAYLQRFMLLAVAEPCIGAVWWYDLFDDGDDPDEREDRFGQLTRSGQPKPAAAAMRELRNFVHTNSPASASLDRDGRIVVRGFAENGAPFVAAWLQSDDFTLISPWPEAKTLRARGFRLAQGGNDADVLSAVPRIFVKVR